MVRPAQERILLIGDADRAFSAMLSREMPSAHVRQVAEVFDGIAEMAHQHFTVVLVPVSRIARRPEAAVRTLRQMSGEGRLLLFGEPALEPLSRQLLDAGCDDYLLTPATMGDFQQALSDAPLRLPTPDIAPASADGPAAVAEDVPPNPLARPGAGGALPALDLLAATQIVLNALLSHPGEALTTAMRDIAAALEMEGRLFHAAPGAAPPPPPAGLVYCQAALDANAGTLHLAVAPARRGAGQALLGSMVDLLSKAAALQDRHKRLQKLAFTDDLTGLFNARYFKHFLTRTLGEAKRQRFPVTLFLFDIDNFKKYNDEFGHGAGDDILKQTASLMRRCVRDHDLVARISGDEFAVVFWEKEGPRTPRESRDNGASASAAASRPPSEPRQILERFRRLLATQTFPLLGPGGKGTLTISGGLAVYPYDANEAQPLIDAADKALMFGAKRSGRNSITLVGE